MSRIGPHAIGASEELANDPGPARGRLFFVEGRARLVERLTLPSASPLSVHFQNYYRLEVELPSDARVTLFTRQVPAVWEQQRELDEPVAAHALFLKVGVEHLAFAASRVAWHPSSGGLGNASEVALARFGMDIARFDDVRGRNRQPLGPEDRECLYRLLAVVERAGPG